MKPTRKTRVMHIIARMNVGGPAIIVAEIMREVDGQKFDQVLITGYCEPNEADYLETVAVDLFATRIGALGRSVSLFYDIKSFFTLLGLIRSFDPDIIHTHTAKAGVLGRLAGLVAKPKAIRIHTYHGHLLYGYFSPWKTQLVIKSERVLARISHSIIAIGNVVKEELLAAKVGNREQYYVIFPGLKPLLNYSKLESRSAVGLKMDQKYLVFIGRLTSIKRPDRLIEIARHLKNNHNNVELLIVGEGDLYAETKEISKSENLPINFLGWRNDIDRILSASDIAILCSDNEGIPLTLIEAAQAGLPIVATNVGSVGDIVLDGETGILVKNDSRGLIMAIDDLLLKPEKMDQFGKAGKLRAETLFSLEGMVKAHENLYSQALHYIN